MNVFEFKVHGFFRERRGAFMRERFPGIESMRVCDLGGSVHFWQKVGIAMQPDKLTMLKVEEWDPGPLPGSAAPPFNIVIYDGSHIPFPDGHFDLLVCNSVIEHVPPAERAALAREMMRVARRVFCQTPAYWFPIEPHFIMPMMHWLPKRLAYGLALVSPWRLLTRRNKVQVDSYFFGTNLLRHGELQALFPKGTICEERMLGMAKSYYMVCGPSP